MSDDEVSILDARDADLAPRSYWEGDQERFLLRTLDRNFETQQFSLGKIGSTFGVLLSFDGQLSLTKARFPLRLAISADWLRETLSPNGELYRLFMNLQRAVVARGRVPPGEVDSSIRMAQAASRVRAAIDPVADFCSNPPRDGRLVDARIAVL